MNRQGAWDSRSRPSRGQGKGAAGAQQREARSSTRRLKLRHALFLCLLLSGIIPLAISSTVLINQNRRILVDQERDYLVRSAEALSRQVNTYLGAQTEELRHWGRGLVVFAGSALEARLRQPWVKAYLEQFAEANPEIQALLVFNREGKGPSAVRGVLTEEVRGELTAAFETCMREGMPVYRLTTAADGADPLAVLAVPVGGEDGQPRLVIASLIRLGIMEAVFGSGQGRDVTALLADSDGEILWSRGLDEDLRAAIEDSGLLRDLQNSPLHFTQIINARIGGRQTKVEATVSRVEETQWAVAALKPMTAAFAAVNRMVFNTLLSSLLLVCLALLVAVFVARWVSDPLNRLTDTSHKIAAGNFGKRVEVTGLTLEMADLAENFNRMSGYVESYVEQLRQAASANQELFIGSIRAFAAAIDAKDPYTRGHSERVAAVSRSVARYLGFDQEFQQRVWLGALLHDVGKIGVDDRVLKKGGLLTPEEFEQMKQHTVIGAEIMARIDQLKEIIPAIRWHHENWNGRGYPDELRGEQIPLIARIVAVADTFDAVTTSRPYQKAYTLEFAVETITKLTGTRFDAKVTTAFLSAFNAGQIRAAVEAAPAPEPVAMGAPAAV